MTDHFIFAHILHRFLGRVRQHQSLSPQQASSCQNILNCHTQKLGGLDYVCDDCSQHYPRYHSCRHRHCPQCQQTAGEQWMEKRLQDVLPIPYFHLVFTLPHTLNGWAQLHPEEIYAMLFRCAWQTLKDYSEHNRQLQGKLGMTAVLHTWGQALDQHIHLHCLIPGGAINEANGFTQSRRDYLYPNRALAKRFRGKMVSALRQAWREGRLHRITQSESVDSILDALMQKDWVIHTKPHLNKPDCVVRYLARYTYRTAISLSRILDVDATHVCFRWKDYRDNQQKIMRLPGEEFVRRFLLHILPKGLMRIRHYGYLANRVRVKQLEKIRHCLAEEATQEPSQTPDPLQPYQPQPYQEQPAEVPQLCPHCKTGHLILRGIIPSEKERRRWQIASI